ncbi:MAG: AglZ/HisF2 family acetamidino modification protein [Bacteroidetes bacterium]|nr:AglZ/HisF2 family acetamidino modification protein [Bacteroidota bacterium]MCW5897443.1 AglZ/HisF2 family acetamidino modification protein [Bacteroidota bacterium]
MVRTRVIPCLQLVGESLVKTIKFGEYGYIGDPVNTVRIFNELEVDELCFLDIRATKERREPNLDVLRQICDECFMPLAYGGGIHDFNAAKKIFSLGFEKVVVNTHAYRDPSFVTKLSEHFGAQAVIGSIDFKKTLFGKYQVFVNDGQEKTPHEPLEWAQQLAALGAGELLLTSMDRDGTWSGYDVELTKRVASAVTVPVIANGGAGSIEHIGEVVRAGSASAVALGSMVVYQKKGMGVLVNFPDRKSLELRLGY